MTCNICLGRDSTLVKITTTDENNITWCSKLRKCVPEVEWNDELMMCGVCTGHLQVACNFRELCIKSLTPPKKEEHHCEDDDACEDSSCNYASDCDFTCDACAISFATPDEFFQHQKHTHLKVDAKENVHISDGNGTGDYVCYHCDKSYANKLSLAAHIKTKHTAKGATKIKSEGQDANKCEICGVVFSSKYLIRRHVRNVHAVEKKYKCETCGQKFASPVYLSAHKRYHSGERPHICSFCGKAYITASDLYHHEKIHANKRAYKCEKCPKAFNTSSDLHKHKICVHVDRSLWKYVCSYCDRRFPLKTNLDTHTKTHTGEKNFACHMCERRCINQSVLKRHIESHSNVRSFKCNLCNQDYKYQKSLDVHMAKAHGIGNAKIPERIKKYFCHICPKSFFANNKLQKHIRSHTGERPFGCHVCEKRFIDKSYVKQHLKTAHNVSFLPQYEKTI